MTNVSNVLKESKDELPSSDKGNIALRQIFKTDHNFLIPKIFDVGPKEAEELLKLNKKNRGLKKRHVKWLSIQMKLGYWVFCGQVIGIDKDGDLINLQHTLHAIIDSATTQKFICICGLPNEAIHVMDTGTARTASDVLQMNGIKNATVIASTVTKIISLEMGHFSGLSGTGGYTRKTSKNDDFKSNTKVLEIVKENEDYWQELQKISAIFYRSFPGFTQSEYGALYHFARKLDEKDAWEFFSKLSSGIGLNEGAPMYHLRKKLEKEISSKVKHSAREKLFWTISSWNKFREGTPMFQMSSYNSASVIPEMI